MTDKVQSAAQYPRIYSYCARGNYYTWKGGLEYADSKNDRKHG